MTHKISDELAEWILTMIENRLLTWRPDAMSTGSASASADVTSPASGRGKQSLSPAINHHV
jgi:hypothetical protein